MLRVIDLNSDVGESFGRWRLGDEEILPFVTSVNVACGMHAGDPVHMDEIVGKACELKLAIGAHPGFPDLQGFGRRQMNLTPREIETYVLYQVSALKGFVASRGSSLTHVKPHGALYNMAMVDDKVARALARGVARAGERLILVGLPGSCLLQAADAVGLPTAAEAFADRAYNSDGTLVERGLPGSIIEDPDEAARRALDIALRRTTRSTDGKEISIPAKTICVHGDTPGAVEIAKRIRQRLESAGVALRPLCEVVAD
ncbi:MAG: LamB/YcsF family protein [Firmicutes bacterium]|nr:LamB/YcsF family protein [Candidatus Fermentithermobacillaceae bacterium]